MSKIQIRPPWYLPESAVTPQSCYLDRRRFLQGLGAIGATGLVGCKPSAAQDTTSQPGRGVQTAAALASPIPAELLQRFPAPRNPAFAKLPRPLTPERVAARYNNFYEFTTDKEKVHELVSGFQTRPWTLRIDGLCNKPGRFDVDELLRKLPLEERVYRFRCVEAWSMVVPWTGTPLAKLLDRVEPLSSARYLRFTTFMKPKEAPGQRLQPWYPWPYFEALRMDEARNDLCLLTSGIYGHPLPTQHGAPLRLVVPWKYGFKSIKSIVHIELVATKPQTFWHKLAPKEYSFEANVEPTVPHPRWSQASERVIGSGERIPTLPFNGYAAQVASLYRRG